MRAGNDHFHAGQVGVVRNGCLDFPESRARLDAGEKLPDISGATKMLQEALAREKN